MLNFCGIVVAILKMETGRNFSMSGINSGRWNRTMLNLCGIVAAILKMVIGRNFFNVGNQFGTSLSTHISNFDDIGQYWIFAVLWRPCWKWRPIEIFQCRESIRDIIIYPHIKFWWYRTLLNFRGIVVVIKFWWYRKMLNFYRPFFMPCFGRHLENFENTELLL